MNSYKVPNVYKNLLQNVFKAHTHNHYFQMLIAVLSVQKSR